MPGATQSAAERCWVGAEAVICRDASELLQRVGAECKREDIPGKRQGNQ